MSSQDECYCPQNTSNNSGIHYEQTISHQKIQRMKSIFKYHKAAIDFDKSFTIEVVSATDFDRNKNVLGEKKQSRKRKRKTSRIQQELTYKLMIDQLTLLWENVMPLSPCALATTTAIARPYL